MAIGIPANLGNNVLNFSSDHFEPTNFKGVEGNNGSTTVISSNEVSRLASNSINKTGTGADFTNMEAPTFIHRRESVSAGVTSQPKHIEIETSFVPDPNMTIVRNVSGSQMNTLSALDPHSTAFARGMTVGQTKEERIKSCN